MNELKKIALESVAIAMDELRRDMGLSGTPEELKQDSESMLILAEAFHKIKKS